MLGLSTSLVDLDKKDEREVKLRKISKRNKRFSSEEIADLFNVTAGVYIKYIILSSSLTDCREDPGGRPGTSTNRLRQHQTEKSWLQTEHQR